MKKPTIKLPVIVEGRHDRQRLISLFDAHIITTEGFGIFRESEKRELIRRLAADGGVIVMTDSDGGGLVIRNYLRSVLPAKSIYHVYIPQVRGKERRKSAPSKEGLLGVEGIDADTLLKLLEPFISGECETAPERIITKADFYADGFSGQNDSGSRRKKLASALGLPKNLSANALLEAVNMLRLHDGYEMFKNRKEDL